LSDKYKAFITGEGLDDFLQRFTPTEPEELFKQRLRITKHIVSCVCKNLMDVAYKVPRSNSIMKIVAYPKDKQKSKEELDSVLKMFNGDDGDHNDYMNKNFVELSYLDPNAFVIVEWPYTDGKDFAQTYALEIMSKDVMDLAYDKKVLQYLICQTDIGLVVYLKNQSITFTKVDPETVNGFLKEKEEKWYVINAQGVDYLVTSPTSVYQITPVTPHNLGYVPAQRVGYYTDLFERSMYVNPLHYAFPYLEKTLKLNSEQDLTSALVAHPEKLQYVSEKCDYDGCYEGRLDGGNTCPKCRGAGVSIATSVQHVITFPLPKNKEDIVDLNGMLVYKSPDVAILEWQENAIDRLTEKCKSVVFNTDLFDRKQVADTATGKNIDLQNVYDTLYAFALKFSRVWEFIVTTTAKVIQREQGLVCVFSFSKDFKMKSVDNLIDDLGRAYDSKAGPAIIQHINNDIMRIIYEDTPEQLKRYEIREFYNPFSGKSQEEILMLLGTTTLTTEYNRVLYVHLGEIFDQLEVESSEKSLSFYQMARPMQQKLIDEKVQAIIDKIEAGQPDPTFNKE
jgi:hypothetical protein